MKQAVNIDQNGIYPVRDLGVIEWWSNEAIIVSNTPSLHYSNSFKMLKILFSLDPSNTVEY
jgi:hypothetical protein